MFKLYNNQKKVFPINNSTDHYISIYKLHYKPFYFTGNNKNLYKKQLKICERLCYGIKLR
jgi:hypothetical protein